MRRTLFHNWRHLRDNHGRGFLFFGGDYICILYSIRSLCDIGSIWVDMIITFRKPSRRLLRYTSNPQLRLLRLNGLGFDQISYADGGN